MVLDCMHACLATHRACAGPCKAAVILLAGRMVWLDRLEQGLEHRLVEYSPQLPQGFTPVDNITFWPGSRLCL